MLAKATEFLLTRVSLQYREMSFENQRNTVTYVLDTFITGVVLVLQLFSVPIHAKKYTFDYMNMLKAAVLLISRLYIFELTYRPCMRWPLLIDHFCTVFAIVLLLSVFSYIGHPALIAAGEIWLFQATTEQTVFIGLFMYRPRVPLRWTCDIFVSGQSTHSSSRSRLLPIFLFSGRFTWSNSMQNLMKLLSLSCLSLSLSC
ncbi:hypothetical protein BT96DRAFT_507022 [Gymnopus androsaceus JB14]|uniref:Ion transport domain-containing protein n=1 Tax=Gymnopus androsaceus JB14 TaxID=1447944 RepID=A0A6A4GNI1_9AGAR|nr:hypothetical protein BT96DRAFT_507022 [Gymnopus androsaceus JB14]